MPSRNCFYIDHIFKQCHQQTYYQIEDRQKWVNRRFSAGYSDMGCCIKEKQTSPFFPFILSVVDKHGGHTIYLNR
jgi:hypothetical protein